MYERHVQARRDSEVDAEEEDGAIRTLLHFQTEQVLLLQLARVGWSTTVIMPLLELGAIAYVTWVPVHQICIQYLIDPSDESRQDFNNQTRRATCIVLIDAVARATHCPSTTTKLLHQLQTFSRSERRNHPHPQTPLTFPARCTILNKSSTVSARITTHPIARREIGIYMATALVGLLALAWTCKRT